MLLFIYLKFEQPNSGGYETLFLPILKQTLKMHTTEWNFSTVEKSEYSLFVCWMFCFCTTACATQHTNGTVRYFPTINSLKPKYQTKIHTENQAMASLAVITTIYRMSNHHLSFKHS